MPGRRGRWWLIAVVVVIVILLGSLKSLAVLYTDSLWFSSVHQHPVWSTLLAVKVGLFASFGAVFFVVLWVNLIICDRLGQSAEEPNPEDELVRRYQQAVRPYSGRIHAALAVVIALIAASGTIGEWQNWILFTHGVPFGVKDPQFGKDDQLLRVPAALPRVPGQLDPGLPGGDPDRDRDLPLPERRHPGPAGLAPGPPARSRPTCRCCWR